MTTLRICVGHVDSASWFEPYPVRLYANLQLRELPISSIYASSLQALYTVFVYANGQADPLELDQRAYTPVWRGVIHTATVQL
jgi:hypothetical protein